MPDQPLTARSERLSGSQREHAEEKVREVQPTTIEVDCCATCGKLANGSFDLGPKLCACSTQRIVRALYRLAAVSDAT